MYPLPTPLLQFDAKADIGDARGRTPLSWACARGHSPLIPNLLDAASCRLGVADADGYTPMMLCAREGHEEAVQVLLPLLNPSRCFCPSL